jgi:ACT domain-containing protein
MSKPNEQWHLSKSVPITLIMGLLIQAVAIVWTVSTMSAGIAENKDDILRNETRITIVERAEHDLALSMVRMETTLSQIQKILERLVKQP